MTPKEPPLAPSEAIAGLRWWLDGRLTRPVREFLSAVIVTTGPWLVFVVVLAVVSISMQPVLGMAGIEDLRLTVVYAFVVAPLVAGPVGVLAARTIREALDARDGRDVSETFLIAAVSSGVLTGVAALVTCLALGLGPTGLAVSFVFLSISAGLLWLSFAVLAALRDHRFLILAFSFGMAISVGTTMVAAPRGADIEMLVWCFTSGVVVCIGLAMSHVSTLFPRHPDRFAPAAEALWRDVQRQRHLLFGVFFALSGIWVDKWIFWFGPEGTRSAAGYLHFATYDSVMFIAHLSMIPCFAGAFLFHDRDQARAIAIFRQTLHDRATYRVVSNAVSHVGQTVWSGITRMLFIQFTIAIALVLSAPLIAQMMSFSFSQFLLLRVGLVAVLLHAVIYLSGTVLMLTGRTFHFMIVQLAFLVLNLVFGIFFAAMVGVSAYGIFASALIMALIAFFLAYRSLARYDYLVFVGENDSLYAEDSR